MPAVLEDNPVAGKYMQSQLLNQSMGSVSLMIHSKRGVIPYRRDFRTPVVTHSGDRRSLCALACRAEAPCPARIGGANAVRGHGFSH